MAVSSSIATVMVTSSGPDSGRGGGGGECSRRGAGDCGLVGVNENVNPSAMSVDATGASAMSTSEGAASFLGLGACSSTAAWYSRCMFSCREASVKSSSWALASGELDTSSIVLPSS